LLEEAELIIRATKGDTTSFGDLFDRYAKDVYRLARSMGHDGEEAEDVMQDTFLAAFEGIARYQGRSSFKTWLFAILFRQSSRKRRYLGIRKTDVFDEQLNGNRNGSGRPAEKARHESRMDVHTMLGTLSPAHRAVMVLRELQGLSYDEIAQALDIPRGTVESRLFRARKILRERFQEYNQACPAPAVAPTKKPVESNHE